MNHHEPSLCPTRIIRVLTGPGRDSSPPPVFSLGLPEAPAKGTGDGASAAPKTPVTNGATVRSVVLLPNSESGLDVGCGTSRVRERPDINGKKVATAWGEEWVGYGERPMDAV